MKIIWCLLRADLKMFRWQASKRHQFWRQVCFWLRRLFCWLQRLFCVQLWTGDLITSSKEGKAEPGKCGWRTIIDAGINEWVETPLLLVSSTLLHFLKTKNTNRSRFSVQCNLQGINCGGFRRRKQCCAAVRVIFLKKSWQEPLVQF